MLKRCLGIIVSVCISISFTSCSAFSSFLNDGLQNVCSAIKDNIVNDSSEVTANSEEPPETCTAEPYDFPASAGGYRPVEKSELIGYNHLNDVQKNIYDEMYSAIQHMNIGYFSVGDCTKTDIAIAFQTLCNDCPQLIWLPDHYRCYKLNGKYNVVFTDNLDRTGSCYLFKSEKERNDALDKLYDAVFDFINDNISPGMTAVEKEIAVHDRICELVEYDHDAADSNEADSDDYYSSSWTAYGALVEHKAVCAGYAYAFQLIMNCLGINCSSVLADAGGDRHILNVAEIDGSWNYVDVTWDDKEVCGLDYTHDYFNIGYDVISETHEIYKDWKTLLNEDESIIENDALSVSYKFNSYLPECGPDSPSYYEYNGTLINNEESFGQTLIDRFSDGHTRSAEFRVAYTDIDERQITKYLERYHIIRELSKYGVRVDNIDYSVLINGVFVLELNYKQRILK